MINVCDRWAHDHTDNLQAAFFNGVGFESWENIWGIWNQMTPRDAEALRRISRIYRAFSGLLVSMDWTPHAPTLQYGVYASRFPAAGRTLWTIVNRNEFDIRDEVIAVEHMQGRRYYDVWNGVEMTPRVDGGRAELSLTLEEHGYGAVLTVDAGAHVENLSGVLEQMHAWAAKPLQSYSKEWQVLPQRIVEMAPTAPAAGAPLGMVHIPGGAFEFNVSGIEIEGSDMTGGDV